MDCPGGRLCAGVALGRVKASTLVLMDCPGGQVSLGGPGFRQKASTLVLMDCPGGLRFELKGPDGDWLQPLF